MRGLLIKDLRFMLQQKRFLLCCYYFPWYSILARTVLLWQAVKLWIEKNFR